MHFFKSILLYLCALCCLMASGVALAGEREQFVDLVQFEGNTLFDHDTLAARVDMGDGIMVDKKLMRLFAEEVRAYYAANGFYNVLVYPDYRVVDGIITFKIDESAEFEHNRLTAVRMVKRAYALSGATPSREMQKMATDQLTLAFADRRMMERDRRMRQRENIERYVSLRIKEMREKTQAFASHREKIREHEHLLLVKMRENAVRRLEQMAAVQALLDQEVEEDLLP
ncbi:MAG: hypothetical protein G3M78_09745 [Candidatus Nitrohelix vancouverensis]|uniref:POTRA domain-containing protein n=1 Tax=Candidatus Nitrohelix vancouverensis TaxID=2705534 RepID=A0A7T0G3Q4_9BACT|nr:MAG: hypothetical protein G3M78_09745 [Candidatus Nitrohelix vancouverensis]